MAKDYKENCHSCHCSWAAHDHIYGKAELVCTTINCGCEYAPKEMDLPNRWRRKSKG
jgi:hypothetical protein